MESREERRQEDEGEWQEGEERKCNINHTEKKCM